VPGAGKQIKSFASKVRINGTTWRLDAAKLFVKSLKEKSCGTTWRLDAAKLFVKSLKEKSAPLIS
jgi:hypothetical protein